MVEIKDISKCYRDAYQFEKRAEYAKQNKLYGLEVEITRRCFSGCSYCYASFVKKWDTSNELTTKEWKRIFDQAIDMGIRCFSWPGGDALLRSDWDILLEYLKEKGGDEVRHFFASPFSALTDYRKAKRLVELADDLLVHFDSINKSTFLETHPVNRCSSAEWERSLRGIHLLLDAGYDPRHMHLAVPIIKPLIKDMEATFDYFFDYIGVGSYAGGVFKPAGRGWDVARLVPSRAEIRYVYELRAKKMNNPAMLALGPTATGKLYCETTIAVNPEGCVKGCDTLPDSETIADLRQENLKDVWEKNKDSLKCPVPEGHCGVCENRHICYGCRANAYYFGRNWKGSDPSCWNNPDGSEVYNEYLTGIGAASEGPGPESACRHQ